MPLLEARLQFDPAHPETSRLEASIDTRSIATDNPSPGYLDTLQGAKWLDAAALPLMTFRSTSVTAVSDKKLRVVDDFTPHGLTRPVSLDVTYNGGDPGRPRDPKARIGFSAKGMLERSVTTAWRTSA